MLQPQSTPRIGGRSPYPSRPPPPGALEAEGAARRGRRRPPRARGPRVGRHGHDARVARSRSGPCSLRPRAGAGSGRARRWRPRGGCGPAGRARPSIAPTRGRGRTGSTTRRRRSETRTRPPQRGPRTRPSTGAASRARSATPANSRWKASRVSSNAPDASSPQRARWRRNSVSMSAPPALGLVREAVGQVALALELALLAPHLGAKVGAARGQVGVPVEPRDVDVRAGVALQLGARSKMRARDGRPGSRSASSTCQLCEPLRPSSARAAPAAGRSSGAQTGPSSSAAPCPMNRATRTGRSRSITSGRMAARRPSAARQASGSWRLPSP